MTSIRSIGAGLGARCTYANVMSTLAFVIAFGGGTAYATHLVVDSSDIVDGQVMYPDLATTSVTGTKVVTGSLFSSDVANNSLVGDDIADESLTGDDIAANSLRSGDIAESSLATVPSATKAANVNGVRILPLEFLAPSGTADRVILNSGAGVKISASCSSTGDLTVWLFGDRNARVLMWSIDSDAGEINNERAFENFTSSNSYELVRDDDGDQSGQASYMTSGGDVVTIVWAADNNSTYAFPTQCAFFGTAFIH